MPFTAPNAVRYHATVGDHTIAYVVRPDAPYTIKVVAWNGIDIDPDAPAHGFTIAAVNGHTYRALAHGRRLAESAVNHYVMWVAPFE